MASPDDSLEAMRDEIIADLGERALHYAETGRITPARFVYAEIAKMIQTRSPERVAELEREKGLTH